MRQELDALIESETAALKARITELEGYIDSRNTKVLSGENPAIARVTELEKALKNARIALTFYREYVTSHDFTRYPFGEQVEYAARKLLGEAGQEVNGGK